MYLMVLVPFCVCVFIGSPRRLTSLEGTNKNTEMKKWHLVNYRLINSIGPISKTIYTTYIFSEIQSEVLIKNVLTHLFNTEEVRAGFIPNPESVISLNEDGTTTEVESGSPGSKLYNASLEFRKIFR